MPIRIREKTRFGQEVAVFSIKTNLTMKEIAKSCDVNYGTLIDVTVGRTSGIEIVPKVRAFMEQYEKTNAG